MKRRNLQKNSQTDFAKQLLPRMMLQFCIAICFPQYKQFQVHSQCSPMFVRPCRLLGQTESELLSDRTSFCLTGKSMQFYLRMFAANEKVFKLFF